VITKNKRGEENLELVVNGKRRLNGEITVSSAKNAVLPILAAALLSSEQVIIHRLPQIDDVSVITELINNIGIQTRAQGDSLIINGDIKKYKPSYELVKRIRASFLIIGPVLAKNGLVRIALPGGCAIGSRPVDLHLKGFAALGADISFNKGDVVAKADKLIGSHIYLDYPSVGATENIIMAAALAEGTTYIENAALEPEIIDLSNFINSMGGKICGAGSNVIKITGVKELKKTEYAPIPDRIEAGTYMIAAAASKGEVTVKNVIPEHLKAVSAKLIESGAEVEEKNNEIYVCRHGDVRPVYIKTLPYPGFPTDMQAQITTYLSIAKGSSILSESVFENRFMHVQELTRMGADIRTEGRTVIIKGSAELTGTDVYATDLRAGAALLIAALMAKGKSVIHKSEHIDRGYENIVEKMNKLGAEIKER
jgi:UDP-N-acetylglucosamine 1-carboxyvinyltransferase